MNKNTLRYLIWVFCVTLWITIFFVLPDFADNPIHDIKGFFQVTLYLIAIGSATFPWIYAFGTYRLISSFMIPIIGLIGAALSFYRIGYHATLTPMLIESILHTNIEETLGVISWQIILWVVLNFCIGLGLVWIRWQRIVLQYSWIHFIIAVLIGTCFYFSNERLHISLRRRFPFNVPYMFYSYKTMRQESLITRQIPTYTPIDIPDSLTIVLIIGEAVRADHLQLNGYKRETTPRLIRRSNIISFPHIYSEETHTIGSLPYILTRADSIHEQFQYSETSFITILKENGYKTAWLSSQDISSTYAYYIAECDTIIFPHPEKAVNIFGKWYDEDLIPCYQNLLHKDIPRSLYIFHQIGSHWYYDSHVPQNMHYFQPTTKDRVVTSNTIESIVNSYDNTIRYMDYFVDSIISTLENRNAIVIYQSDHGEALGENGAFLHANDAEPAKHPACIIWYSDSYATNNKDKVQNLKNNQDKHYRTDYVFYSILWAAGIEATGSNTDMNIFW